MLMSGALKTMIVLVGLATAFGEFGPITSVEVRALGSLAYGTLSPPKERSPARPRYVPGDRVQVAREVPSPAQTAQLGTQSEEFKSSYLLRGGDGVPAFATGNLLSLSRAGDRVGLGLRRCASAQELVRNRLRISDKDLEHRAVSLRRISSGEGIQALCSQQVVSEISGSASRPASALDTIPASSSRGLLRTQGTFHHLGVIARAASNTPFCKRTAAMTMTIAPGSDIPADSSLQYPAASTFERGFACAAGALVAAVALVLDSRSLAVSWVRSIAISTASFLAGMLAWSVVQSESRIRPYLRSEADAAYSDSKFVSAGAVTAHYLEALPSSGKPTLTLLCLHGFGASCASYRLVLQPLAEALQARVLAVDMPGFGLTNRPRLVKDFCPQQMVSSFVQSLGLAQETSTVPLVLMGHSLGGLVAAKHVVSTQSAVAAAVLVAPLVVHSGADVQSAQAVSASAKSGRARRMLSASFKAVAGAAGAFLKYGIQGLVRLLMPVLALALRRMVYTPDFWPQALGATYYDRSNLREEIVAGYRRASWVQGWEGGLLNFVRFRMTAGKTLYEMLRQAWRANLDSAPPATSTAQALGSSGKPLLFIHGEGDKVIPCVNSRVVSAVLAGQADFVEVKKCGHCPMEEQPSEFVESVSAYLKRVLAPCT